MGSKAVLAGWLTILFSLGMTGSVTAIDEFADVKTISELPISERGVEALFDRTAADACEEIRDGEPFEISSFIPYLTTRDRLTAATRPLSSARHSLFSVGLEFERDDRADLPAVSGGIIADYLEENCVLIQARVRRDLLDRKLYFHHRPISTTVQYRGTKLTQPFQPLVSASIQRFHGVGVFASDTRIRKAEHLRTLVLVFKNQILPRYSTRARDQFEFGFVRGREVENKERLEYHVFVTTDDRQTVHYMNAYRQPIRPADCTILGRIVVTDYDASGIYPQASSTRSFRLDSRQAYAIDDLNDYCQQAGWAGGFHLNVPAALDAIIDGKLQ